MSDQNLSVWLGGMFIPEAYITASRQYVAQANSWSLEELGLQVSSMISQTHSHEQGIFAVIIHFNTF